MVTVHVYVADSPGSARFQVWSCVCGVSDIPVVILKTGRSPAFWTVQDIFTVEPGRTSPEGA